MTPEIIDRLRNYAERGNDLDSRVAMKNLKMHDSTFHFCCDWDGLVICKDDPEFEFCDCFKNG